MQYRGLTPTAGATPESDLVREADLPAMGNAISMHKSRCADPPVYYLIALRKNTRFRCTDRVARPIGRGLPARSVYANH